MLARIQYKYRTDKKLIILFQIMFVGWRICIYNFFFLNFRFLIITQLNDELIIIFTPRRDNYYSLVMPMPLQNWSGLFLLVFYI